MFKCGILVGLLHLKLLQETLLELKGRNYSLEEQARKQKNALGEAEARVKVTSFHNKSVVKRKQGNAFGRGDTGQRQTYYLFV